MCFELCDEELALSHLLADGQLLANSRKYVQEDYRRKPGMVPPKGGVRGGEFEKYYDVVDGGIEAETVILFVICSDVFWWACADAEPFTYLEIEPIYRMWRANPRWGTTKWVCLKRQMRPQPPVMDAMRKDGAWDSDLEALPPRSRADACLAGCCTADTDPVL